MRFLLSTLSLLALASSAAGQTQIGSWKLEEAYASAHTDVYSITSFSGEPKRDTYTSVDFYCDGGDFTFHFLPAADPRTGRNDLPDGLWTVQIFINDDLGGTLSAKSGLGVIEAAVPSSFIAALRAARRRSPGPDVMTVMVEKVDGGRIQKAMTYPATRFRAALSVLADACQTAAISRQK